MDAEALEAALAAKIGTLQIPCGIYPQLTADYVPSSWPGEVLVRYVGCRYSARDVSGLQKDRQQTVELVAVSTELRGTDGIYTWLDLIRNTLEGYTFPEAGGPLELEEEGFLDEYNGTWQFYQRWNLSSKISYHEQDDYADRPLSAPD